MKIALYIPVFNGAKFIEKNLNKTLKFIETEITNAEVFVVNDASNDKTLDILIHSKQSGANFEIIHFDTGPSRRENLGKTMANSTSDWIVFIDADLPFELHEMKKLIEIAITEKAMVIGSRYLNGKTNRGFFRLTISKIYNQFIQLIFKTGVKDHSCGLKVFKTEDFKKIQEYVGYDNSGNRGWFWDTEVIFTAKKLNIKVLEIYITWIEQNSSTFSIRREMKIVLYLLFNLRRIFKPFKSQ